MKHLVLIKEEAPEEWRPGVDQQDPEVLNIKEEEEELWTSLDEEKLDIEEQTDFTRFPFPAVSLKNEDDEERPLMSQLPQHQVVPASSSTDQMTAATGGEDCGGSETIRNPGTLNTQEEDSSFLHNKVVLPADVQLVLIKEEAPGEWRPGVDQQDPEVINIKEEEEELWTSLDEEKLNIKEQTDVTRFPFRAGHLKSEDDEEKPLMSQLPQHQVVPASSSTDQMTAATGGEDCGGAETIRNPGTVNTREEDSSSSETEVSEDDEEEDYINNLDSQLSDTGSKTEDGNNNRMDIRSPESGVGTVETSRKVQTGQTSYGCELCGKRFSKKENLEMHTRVHTGQKPFCCDDCGQSFNHKSNLYRHKKIHTGPTQKPFCCEECGQSFSRKSNLDTHMRIHTGQKPFNCDDCGQSFSRKSHLNSHMRVHTGQRPFCCDDCGQSFKHKSHLNVHLRIHTGQRPFSCGDCGQSFIHTSHLYEHMRIHTGQKPYCCDDCGRHFVRKSHLNSHKRIHRKPNDDS